MKIAVIAPSQIPARRANTIQVMKMSQALQQMGHRVLLISPFDRYTKTQHNRRPYTWQEMRNHYGLEYEFEIDWLPAHPHLRRYDFGMRAVGWAKRWKADMIYTRLPQAAAIASQRDIPTVFEIHDFPQGWLGPKLLRAFVRGRGANRLVGITRNLTDDLCKKWPDLKSRVIIVTAPDGVDLRRYENFPTTANARQMLRHANKEGENELALDIQADQFVVGYTGHLYAGRGIELILEIARRLAEMTFLVVGGEAGDAERLRALIKNAKLDNIILTGFVPNAELPIYQAACDVLVMPYQSQVAASSGGDIARYLSPMKLFEYMACERTILSSNLPVLQEILNAKNAVLVPPGDVESWVKSLVELRNHPDLRHSLAKQASLDVTAYTWEERARKIFEETIGL